MSVLLALCTFVVSVVLQSRGQRLVRRADGLQQPPYLALQPLEFGTHLLPFLQLPAGDSIPDRAPYSLCQRLLQPCMISTNIVLHPAIGLRMRLFQRISHAARIQIIVVPNFQHHQHLRINFFVYFARVYVQVPLLAGRCPDAMSLRTTRPSLLLPCHSWPLQQYLPIPSQRTEPDFCSRWTLPFLRIVNVGKPHRHSNFVNIMSWAYRNQVHLSRLFEKKYLFWEFHNVLNSNFQFFAPAIVDSFRILWYYINTY